MAGFGNTTITYNAFTFSNAGTWGTDPPAYPVPFISKTVEYFAPEVSGGENRWCRKETITLKGQINGCGDDSLEDKRQALIDAFKEDFHTLQVEGYEDFKLVRVMSVDVGPQEGAKTFIDYSITLESYPEDSFAQKYRVIDPSDVINVSENDDASATITHTVSCRGLNTAEHGSASNALANAKTFVEEKIASEECLRGTIIKSEDPDWGKHLVSVTEDINRITAEYSMTKTYASDLARKEGGEIVVRHTKSIDEAWGQRRKITHSGKIDAGRDGFLKDAPDGQDARSAYKDLKGSFNDPVAAEPFLVSEDIQEDEINKSITFTIVLEEGRPDVIDDYSITVSEDSAGSLVKISIQGTISATGPAGCRMAKVRKHFCGAEDCVASAKNINGRYALYCEEAYEEYLEENEINNLPQDVVFQDDALAVSVTENTFASTISYSMQFDNRITHGHHKANHTMSFKPSLEVIVKKELNRPTYCNDQDCGNPPEDVGGGSSFDLLWMGFRDRCEFGIAGQITYYDPDDPEASTMEGIALNKYGKYCGALDPEIDDAIRLQRVESLDRSSNSSYDSKWSFHSPVKSVNKYGSLREITTFDIKK